MYNKVIQNKYNIHYNIYCEVTTVVNEFLNRVR